MRVVFCILVVGLVVGNVYHTFAAPLSKVNILEITPATLEGPIHHGLVVVTDAPPDPNRTSFEIQFKKDDSNPIAPWKVYQGHLQPYNSTTLNLPYRNGLEALQSGQLYCLRVRALHASEATGWSQKCGLQLVAPPASNNDTDGDGLGDAEEYALGTDPNNPDSDLDGKQDGSEVAHSDDPNKALLPKLLLRSAQIMDFGYGDLFGQNPGQHLWIELENVGSAPAVFSSIAVTTPELAQVFHIGAYPPLLTHLTPNNKLLLPVSFIPTSAGPVKAQLLVESDSIAEIKPITLVGNGVGFPTCTVSPQILDFGKVDHQDQDVTLKYITLSSQWSGAEPEGVASFDTIGFVIDSNVEGIAPGMRSVVLPVGEEVTLPVLFQHLQPGDYSGELEIRSFLCPTQTITINAEAY